MKKTIIALSLIAITSLVASEAFKTEVALTAGYNKFDSASKMENASLFGIRATVYENEVNMYGLQVGYEGSMGIEYNKEVTKTDLHRFFTHLVVDGEEEYDVTPYLFLGLGYEYLSDEIKGEPSQGFIDFGLGFKYFIDKNFNILLETRAVGKFDTRDLDLTTNLGLGYRFGGKYSAKIKPIIALDEHKRNVDTLTSATKIHVVDIPSVKESTIPSYQYPEEVSDIAIEKGEKVSTYHDNTPTMTTPTVSYKEEVLVSDGYYVQMAAYKSTPTQALIDTLTENGYSNTLVYPRGDTTLVLVGPFVDREEAIRMQSALRSIRRDAFIYKMK